MRSASILIAVLTIMAAAPARAGVEADFETGFVFSGRNDTRIPGDDGTKFSLVDDLSTSPAPFFRMRVGYRFAQRHFITALYAPLAVTARGSVERDIFFKGATYPANSPLLAVYRFDSYRVTYRYSFLQREGLDVAGGLTAKIRVAETSLYGVEERRKTNVGVVPLLNLHAAWRPHNGPFGVLFDADALAAPQGRAEDVLIAATWTPRPDWELRVGYRTVEGGADNSEVYSFAWFHYLVVGLGLTF